MKYYISLIFVFTFFSAQAQLIDTLILVEERVLLFESDEWQLSEGELMKMDTLVKLATRSDKVLLEGHTDKVGSERYNERLSAKRVRSVLEELIYRGIGEDKIETSLYGELKPVIFGEDESAYKFNRRVTLQFYTVEKRRVVSGRVEEEETQVPLVAKIRITGKDFVDSMGTNKDGIFSIALPDKGLYKFEISSHDHFFDQIFIKVAPDETNDIKVRLPKIKIGSIYILPNFNFKGDLPVLLSRSVPTLELLYDLLLNNDVCIEIKGHINLPNQPDCEKDTKHYKLSVDRANMVYNNMILKGINSDRMLPRGYGNWEMLFPEASTEINMEKNRRVEIKVIECDAEALVSKNLKL